MIEKQVIIEQLDEGFVVLLVVGKQVVKRSGENNLKDAVETTQSWLNQLYIAAANQPAEPTLKSETAR